MENPNFDVAALTLEGLVTEYLIIKDRVDALDALRKEIRGELVERLQPGSHKIADAKVRIYFRSGLDIAAIAADYPNDLEIRKVDVTLARKHLSAAEIEESYKIESDRPIVEIRR